MSFNVGESVFFHHPKHSWVLGQVTATDGKTYSCKVDDPARNDAQQGTIDKLKPDHLQPMQADVLDERVDDLLNLTILHDSTLLRCLYLRYMDDIIYTNIGAIVVALNPFNFEIPRYMDTQMQHYLAEGPVIRRNVPHSWAQAHNTYYEMINDKGDQCILISGESGAGKTEATKIVMKYLAAVSCLNASASENEAGRAVGIKLSSCSPILESFGNARTVRNDNSSRFGKFAKVKFSGTGVLIGAHTTKYLLEKSRIITASLNERVYHSFYIVTRGRFKAQLGLELETNYKSLNSGNCLQNKEYNSPEDFDEVCGAMKGVGMSEEEIWSVWLIPAGILSLLNLNFTEDGEGKSVIDESKAKYLQHTTRLWGIDEVALRRELTTKTITLPGQGQITSRVNVGAAIDTRDALCKAAYDGVFSWLVDKCNTLCDVPATGNWIGLLDIFGFEDFEKNSFEQLCINLANETLQNHYNAYIFTKDMDECRAEKIDVTEIKCPDNGPCLDLICKTGGIIPLLDQQCAVDGTDEKFLDDVFANHGNDAPKKHPFLFQPKIKGKTFTIHHYAASVVYDVAGWVEKNRDTLRDEVKILMRRSNNQIVKIVLPEPIPMEDKKGKQLTVGGFFKDQVKQLMDVINSTNPHWIRCVKPHPAKKPKHFDGIQTMNQLESSGVLGTVKIRKAGYPVRLPNEKFLRRYQAIAPAGATSDASIQAILDAAGIGEKARSQRGLSKVFLKADAYQVLEKKREAALQVTILELHRICAGYMPRKRMFAAYVNKHRAVLLKAKREREEKERAERESAERAKKEAEEKARLAREAEERRRLAEVKRLEEKRNKAAINLQRYIRGGLTRIRIFRKVLEESRADFEAKREAEIIAERLAVKEIDRLRLKSEKSWVNWLTEVEQLHRYVESEQQRRQKKIDEKDRIQKRELARLEQNARRELMDEESTDRFTLQAKCDVIAKHKLELERKAKAGGPLSPHQDASHRRLPAAERQTPKRTAPSPRRAEAHRRAAQYADARTEEVLSSYALNRSRAFEEHFPNSPPPPVNTFSARAKAWEETQSASAKKPGMTPQQSKQLFQRSKNRWERQEEWMDARESVLGPSYVSGSGAADRVQSTNPLDEMYTGSYRTPEALASTSRVAAPPGVYDAPTPGGYSGTAGHSTIPTRTPHMTPGQQRAEQQYQSSVNWDAVFNERMW